MALFKILNFILKIRSTTKSSRTFCRLNFLRPCNNYCFSKTIKRNYVNNEEEQNGIQDIEDDPTDKIQIRNLLHSNSKDALILQLNDCASVQGVFDVIRRNHDKMTPEQISQAVLVLWDLQKVFYKYNIYYETDSITNNLLSANAILQNYITQVNSHEDFETLIKLIEDNYEKFSLEALTCVLLYLNRMGVKLKTNVIQLMIQRCETEIKNSDLNSFPLTCLSRFIVTVFSQDNLYSILVTIDSMPVILRKLDTCSTEEEFKLLTICLHKMKQLVSDDILNKYKNLGEKLLQENAVTKNNSRTIIKTIKFLNQPQWFESNLELTNKFINLLKGSINLLTAAELVSLFKVFFVQKEPANMLKEMQKHASNILSKNGESFEINLQLLSCLVSFSSPLERPKFEILVKNYLRNDFTLSSLSSIYRILYFLNSPEMGLCNNFWEKSLKYILNEPNNLQNIINLSQKYIYFSSNISYYYRFTHFEKTVIEFFNNELKNNIYALIPAKYSQIAAFIIAYSVDYKYTEKILDQLTNMIDKFDPNDHLNISKGLQILSENKDLKFNSSISNRIQMLKLSLNNCSLKLLKSNSNLININTLFKSCVLRKENIENELFKNILNSYVSNSTNLSSYIIRETAFCLQINNTLVPELINHIVQYIINKKEEILGTTLDKVLHLCYNLGYNPENADEFFSISSEIIQRDKDMFSGLTFLQSCLALCYFQNLSDVLIKHIFSVHFLEKLDQELASCYAKATYPTRVRDHLMQLNRATCLDYPEFDIPWFHQKYVDEIMKKTPKKDFFHNEVNTVLVDIACETNETLAEDVYTPYGYYLNFVLKSNKNSINSKRTAIFLLYSKAYTTIIPNLKGYYQLRNRHLEILGYNIVGINYNTWKSLYSHENCKKYIKNKINSVQI